MSDYLTTTQAAQVAACSASTLRYAILRGHLPATKFGKTWLITPDDLQAWIENEQVHKTGTKPTSG